MYFNVCATVGIVGWFDYDLRQTYIILLTMKQKYKLKKIFEKHRRIKQNVDQE